MADLQLTVASLRTVADGMVDVVERISTALSELETALQGVDTPWCTGHIGSVFGELYQGIHDMAMDSFETNAEVMSEYAEGLGTMADTIEQLETQIKQGFVNLEQDFAEIFRGRSGPQ